jgi:hypothetical protein
MPPRTAARALQQKSTNRNTHVQAGPVVREYLHHQKQAESVPRVHAMTNTSNHFGSGSNGEISNALTVLSADMFTLYVKKKNFHRHVSGPHFRDYHLLLDEQAAQIFGTTDTIAEHANETARRHGSDG